MEDPLAQEGDGDGNHLRSLSDNLLQELSATVQSGVDKILRAFEDKLAWDASKQQQIDKLHAELQQHRNDLVAQSILPLIRSVIRHYRDIGRLRDNLEATPRDPGEAPNLFDNLLSGLQDDVELLLDQNGITAYRNPTDRVVDPARQRVIAAQPTDDEREVGLVARSLVPGFEHGDSIIEKECVVAFALETKPSPETVDTSDRPEGQVDEPQSSSCDAGDPEQPNTETESD